MAALELVHTPTKHRFGLGSRHKELSSAARAGPRHDVENLTWYNCPNVHLKVRGAANFFQRWFIFSRTEPTGEIRFFRFGSILMQRSKIEQPKKSREGRSLALCFFAF